MDTTKSMRHDFKVGDVVVVTCDMGDPKRTGIFTIKSLERHELVPNDTSSVNEPWYLVTEDVGGFWEAHLRLATKLERALK